MELCQKFLRNMALKMWTSVRPKRGFVNIVHDFGLFFQLGWELRKNSWKTKQDETLPEFSSRSWSNLSAQQWHLVYIFLAIAFFFMSLRSWQHSPWKCKKLEDTWNKARSETVQRWKKINMHAVTSISWVTFRTEQIKSAWEQNG